MTDSEENIWLKSTDDILKLNREKLKIDIISFHENTEVDEITELDTLINAVNRAKAEINDIKILQIQARVSRLEDANSMSFMQLAFDLALGVFSGGVIAFVAKSALGRILKSRLLVGTVRSKIRIAEGTKSSQRQKMKRSSLLNGKDYKYNTRRHHFDIKMIHSVNLDPNSWESIFLASVPEIIGGRIDEAVQSRNDIETFHKDKTVTAAEFFTNQITALTSQKKNTLKEYVKLRNSIKKKLINITEDELKEIIVPITEVAKFEEKNKIGSSPYSDEDKEKILSQPIIIGACFQMAFVPDQILSAQEYRGRWLINGPMEIQAAKPERVKASFHQKVALTAISKILFVPELLKGKNLKTFYDYYSGDRSPDRPQVEVVKYFNKIRGNHILNALRKISLELVKYLSSR